MCLNPTNTRVVSDHGLEEQRTMHGVTHKHIPSQVSLFQYTDGSSKNAIAIALERKNISSTKQHGHFVFYHENNLSMLKRKQIIDSNEVNKLKTYGKKILEAQSAIQTGNASTD